MNVPASVLHETLEIDANIEDDAWLISSELPILEAQLDGVARELSLAVKRPSCKQVHQLRIATRRALVGLELHQAVLPEQEFKWLRKQLRKVRRAAGATRDLDVLQERHPNDRRLSKMITKRRAKAFRLIHRVHRRLLDEGRFATHQNRLLDPLLRPSVTKRLNDDDLLLDAFDVLTADFLARARQRSFETETLHRLRKQGKRLRYAVEILSGILPQDFVQDLHQTTKKLQNQLGEINDHVVAGGQFAYFRKKTNNKKMKKRWRQSRNDEHRQLKKSIRRLKAWWTPALLGELEEALKRDHHQAGNATDG